MAWLKEVIQNDVLNGRARCAPAFAVPFGTRVHDPVVSRRVVWQIARMSARGLVRIAQAMSGFGGADGETGAWEGGGQV